MVLYKVSGSISQSVSFHQSSFPAWIRKKTNPSFLSIQYWSELPTFYNMQLSGSSIFLCFDVVPWSTVPACALVHHTTHIRSLSHCSQHFLHRNKPSHNFHFTTASSVFSFQQLNFHFLMLMSKKIALGYDLSDSIISEQASILMKSTLDSRM